MGHLETAYLLRKCPGVSPRLASEQFALHEGCGQGRTVDFKNTVIVMTSNLGSNVIQDMTGKPYEAMKKAVMEIVAGHFRPEFINRIDESVVFHALDQAQIQQIADVQIEQLANRLKDREIKLEVNQSAIAFLAEAGYDPVYGARPLKRAIQQFLENPLAQDILAGKFKSGDEIKVTKGKEGLIFKSA